MVGSTAASIVLEKLRVGHFDLEAAWRRLYSRLCRPWEYTWDFKAHLSSVTSPPRPDLLIVPLPTGQAFTHVSLMGPYLFKPPYMHWVLGVGILFFCHMKNINLTHSSPIRCSVGAIQEVTPPASLPLWWVVTCVARRISELADRHLLLTSKGQVTPLN